MIDYTKPQDPFKVPASLADAYKREAEPTELEVLKALQGDGLRNFGAMYYRAMWPNRATVDERTALEQAKAQDFDRFVTHAMKLERITMRIQEQQDAIERAQNKEAREKHTTCPVCHEIAPDNYRLRPCKRCAVVIERKLAESKSREAAVDKWLKSNEYSWVGR